MRIFIWIWNEGAFGGLFLYITLDIPTNYLLLRNFYLYDMR